MSNKTYKAMKETLRKTAADPFHFSDLVDKWNAIFDAEEAKDPLPNSFETVVDETFQAIAAEGSGDVIGARMRQMINALPYVAFVVRSDGLIAAMNDAALERLTCDPGDQASQVGYALESGEDLSAIITKALDRRNSGGDVIMKRAVSDKDDRSATFAIVSSLDDGIARALVFIIDPVWGKDIQALLSRTYNLTSAEQEILMAFLDGKSLQDIADSRERSRATVRTQFQTILNKAGASSRAELMRNAIAVSQFFTSIRGVAEVARHPNRRRFDILRADGRSIDVTLTGDMSGPLIVSIPDTTQFLFPARIEKAFQEAGLCVAFVCRPGTGRTDPNPKSEDYMECLAEDISAVLDQMGRRKTVLLANSMSSIFGYRLGALIPDRLSRIVVTSTLVPGPQLDGTKTRSPWARALMRAVGQSPSMYKIMIHSAIKAWRALGSRRMYLMQLKGFEPDVIEGKRPEVVAAYDAAMRSTLSQGSKYAVIAFEYAAQDWTEWINICTVPIEIIQGQHDPSSDCSVVRAFAAQHPKQITLHVLPDAGYLTFLTHTETMVCRLEEYARAG